MVRFELTYSVTASKSRSSNSSAKVGMPRSHSGLQSAAKAADIESPYATTTGSQHLPNLINLSIFRYCLNGLEDLSQGPDSGPGSHPSAIEEFTTKNAEASSRDGTNCKAATSY